jgi:hypothetical protein
MPFLSEKVIAFLVSDNFQPLTLYSTERQFFLNFGNPVLENRSTWAKPKTAFSAFLPLTFFLQLS